MALTRKMLKGMGISEEQADTIIEAHAETVDGLKDQLKAAQGKADQLDGVQKELDALKAKNGDDWKGKYDKERAAFEAYKSEQTAKEMKAAKEAAARAYFEGKNITGGNLSIAMRGAKDEINGLELDSDGKIKDPAALDALVSGEYAALVVKTETRGAQTATPPASGGKTRKTRAEIMAIKDTAERQKAIAENLSEFGY